MSVTVDKAIKTRWTARSLSSTITGGIHRRAPPGTSMPYCIFSDVSDTPVSRSRSSRYNRKLVQFDVYHSSDVTAGELCELIKAAFCNADEAAANALSIVASAGVIQAADVEGNPIILQESDEVYRATMTLGIRWAENRNLVPTA